MKLRSREKKVRVHAFRKEVRTHKWLLYILAVMAFLVLVYEWATNSLSLQLFAGMIFALVLIAFIADMIHKRNVKMLKLAVTIFAVSLIASSFARVPAVYAYSLNEGSAGSLTGTVTSSNGAITIPIPYVTPPSTDFTKTSFIASIPLVTVADFNSNPLSWFEDTVINLFLDVVNALIYVVNVVIGFLVAIVAGVISIPVYLFDAISVTTLGPVVDFLSFIPASYAWLATGVVWSISLMEWGIIIIVLVRLIRITINAGAEVLGQEEEGLKEETGELA